MPIVTASGLVYIANTFDPYIRAFDIQTGKELLGGATSGKRQRYADDLHREWQAIHCHCRRRAAEAHG